MHILRFICWQLKIISSQDDFRLLFYKNITTWFGLNVPLYVIILLLNTNNKLFCSLCILSYITTSEKEVLKNGFKSLISTYKINYYTKTNDRAILVNMAADKSAAIMRWTATITDDDNAYCYRFRRHFVTYCLITQSPAIWFKASAF